MNEAILMVNEVSDGLLIQFSGSGICYFPTEFLVGCIGRDSNQVFLDHDPCAVERGQSDSVVSGA